MALAAHQPLSAERLGPLVPDLIPELHSWLHLLGSRGLGGPPDEAELNQPHGVAVAPSGDVYIADSSNHRVLRIER